MLSFGLGIPFLMLISFFFQIPIFHFPIQRGANNLCAENLYYQRNDVK